MANGASGVVGSSCQGPLDPAFRVRLEIPARALASRGISFGLLPLFTAAQAEEFRRGGVLAKARILSIARKRLRAQLLALDDAVDTMVVQRHVDLSPLLSVERTAVERRRLIYDVDDAIWLSGGMTGGSRLGAVKGAGRKVRWLAERAERVIAGNDFLAEYLGRFSNSVSVIPSLIDVERYSVRKHAQSEYVTLGWIGSETTAGYLQRLGPIIERFAERSPLPVRLIVVGGVAPRIQGVSVVQRNWGLGTEKGVLAEMDIGLMPLDDTPWSRGKCAYKALQYMACGIPPVVDDVGISAATIDGAGYVARDDDQWLEGLLALADDASLRARLGEVGRQRIEADFSVRRWLPAIEAVLAGS